MAEFFWGIVHNVVIHPLYVIKFIGLGHFWGTIHSKTAEWAGYGR